MDSSDSFMPIMVIILCLICSAYFSATETAFSSLNKIKIKNLAQKGNKKAQKTLELCEKYDALLSTILIGNNIVNILSSSLATIVCINFFGATHGATISTILMTIIVLIFGEISPKTIAKEFPEQFAMFSMHLIRPIIVLFTPFNWVFGLLKKILSKIFKAKENAGITEEEIFTIVEEAAEAGNIDDEEKDLIQNAIEFNELLVGDIYTPRVDVVAIPKNIDKNEINKIFKETSYSRLPVYDENIDNVIGILNYKDFINKEYENIEDILQKTIFVIKSNKIKEVLRDLQKNKTHLAIVINEYCETIGIITLEDIVEEIVGDIWDEHDEINVEIENTKENEYIISGYAELYVIEDLFGFDIETDINTISGWIMETLGRLPQINDVIEYKNIKVEVLSIQNKRTNKVKIIKTQEIKL